MCVEHGAPCETVVCYKEWADRTLSAGSLCQGLCIVWSSWSSRPPPQGLDDQENLNTSCSWHTVHNVTERRSTYNKTVFCLVASLLPRVMLPSDVSYDNIAMTTFWEAHPYTYSSLPCWVIIIEGVHFTHLEGKVNQVLPFQGSMSTSESNDLCLLHQQVVHPITTAAEQLKCPELLWVEEERWERRVGEEWAGGGRRSEQVGRGRRSEQVGGGGGEARIWKKRENEVESTTCIPFINQPVISWLLSLVTSCWSQDNQSTQLEASYWTSETQAEVDIHVHVLNTGQEGELSDEKEDGKKEDDREGGR